MSLLERNISRQIAWLILTHVILKILKSRKVWTKSQLGGTQWVNFRRSAILFDKMSFYLRVIYKNRTNYICRLKI